ncbi:MAG TPA: primosomal protein N' [Gemmatimonadaceae bacterium]|jgi:primosomal protein N' (replication factor Y)
MTARLVDVALPLPLFRAFTYAVPDGLRHPVTPGTRVLVPFRNRTAIGIVLAESDGASLGGAEPKPILDAPDASPAFCPDLLAVGRWMADYYVSPVGLVLRAALPAAMGRARRADPPLRTQRVLRISQRLDSLLQRDELFKRAPQQRALYELLESLGGQSPVAHLIERLGCTESVVQGLAKRGVAVVVPEPVDRDPFLARAAPPPAAVTPTAAQRAAVAALCAGAPGATFLLHGITGSGKTLVYIEFLRHVLAAPSKSAIVLVPEIALTPQTVDRFRAVFGNQVAVLHSGLSDGERYDAWRALQRGDKRIAIGARSAIFAPLANLGAIVVDEEHEATYKQGEAPRYHAREVAIVRAREAGAVVVLGSATPSLESWTNAQSGKYQLLSLPDRVGGGALPGVRIVDLRDETGPGAPAALQALRRILSAPLEAALHERLARGEQSLLLLNRRGFANFVTCPDGHVVACPNCAISLTYHRAPERLICHYCQHAEPLSATCAECGAENMRQRGVGTQQVERLLNERFPSARVARMDVDTTTGKWAHAEILDRVGRGEVDILLGTQMIAKGLDFPNVTLVGVIDADIGINLPDFRASERTFQLLSQVAGRAGRGPKGGEVFIQTRTPGHHAVICAVEHDYLRFVGEEIPARVSPPYPPTLRLANVVISGLDELAVAACAQQAADWMAPRLEALGGAVSLVGPAPCPIERIKGRWRWHLVLKAARPAPLTQLMRAFLTRFELPAAHEMRVTFDRDPVALL